MDTVIDFLKNPDVVMGILGGLLVVSEALALIPQIKANSIFQAIYNTLQRFKKQPPTP